VTITYTWRGDFTNTELNECHAEAFESRVYRELEAGTALPSFQIWDAICKLYGWSQSFVKKSAGWRFERLARRRTYLAALGTDALTLIAASFVPSRSRCQPSGLPPRRSTWPGR
jgi:hypothetical protein